MTNVQTCVAGCLFIAIGIAEIKNLREKLNALPRSEEEHFAWLSEDCLILIFLKTQSYK